MKITDMPKLECPFVRKEINGNYIATDEIAKGYEWVFEDASVMAIEKLHGTNVSIIITDGSITSFFNRAQRIPFFNKAHKYITEGLLNSYERGYMGLLEDGQHFGELIGPRVNGNPYKLDKHLWIPFETFGQKHLRYKSWGKYPKDFKTLSEWFKELIPLYSSMLGNREDGFVEGIVFTHPDGRMAKLRCDMFDWFKGKRHRGFSNDTNSVPQKHVQKGCGAMYCLISGCGEIDEGHSAYCITHARSDHALCGENGFCKKCKEDTKSELEENENGNNT